MIPVYVTRKNAEGLIGSWTVSPIAAIVGLTLLCVAVPLWLIVAIGQAAQIILGWL